MFDNNCDHYWAEAEWLPNSVVLEWCKEEPKNFEARKNAFLTACQARKIEFAHSDNFPADQLYEQALHEDPFTDFATFLLDMGHLVVKSSSFTTWVSSLSKGSHPMPQAYFDPKHPFFAKELKIAVEAWVELYENNPPQSTPKGGHKNHILDWLKANYPKLSSNAYERIATVINPNPGGGASPSDAPW